MASTVSEDCKSMGRLCPISLADGIGIVGIGTHNIPMGMSVKIPDGKGLHPGKHIVSHMLQRALRNHRHHTGVCKSCRHAQNINDRHSYQNTLQMRPYCGKSFCDPRGDTFVDQLLQKDGGDHRSAGTDYDTHCRRHKLDSIIMRQIRHQPDKCIAGFTGMIIYTHIIPPPCFWSGNRTPAGRFHSVPAVPHESLAPLSFLRP